MKSILLTFCISILMVDVSGQITSISNNDLQYIKNFFAANFIKTPVIEAGKTTTARFDYEITPDAIIIYKTETGTKADTDHWYYLPLGNVRIQNYGSNLAFYKTANAIWFEGKKITLPHGMTKKFTRVADATYNSGWLQVPFKYNSFRDLDKLRDILEPPLQTNKTAATRPATGNKESYNFNAFILRDLFAIATQLDDHNQEAVMKAGDYTLTKGPGESSKLYQYDHKTKRAVYYISDHSDTASLHILKAPFLGMEIDEILKDLETNGIEYAGKQTNEVADHYYFTKPGSDYTIRIEEQKSTLFNFIYLFKHTTRIKKTEAPEDIFSGINVADILSFHNAYSFTVKGKKYSALNHADVASFFNAQMKTASIKADENRLSFVTLGKTDFSSRSIAFIVKNGELHLKINLPLNGTCDYGLKEIKVQQAIISEPYTRGVDNGYYVSVPYEYSCAGIQYNYLMVYIEDTEMASYTNIKRYFEQLPGK